LAGASGFRREGSKLTNSELNDILPIYQIPHPQN